MGAIIEQVEFWGALHLICYLINRLSYVNHLWGLFLKKTDSYNLFNGSRVELRLLVITFLGCLLGFGIGYLGYVGQNYLYILRVLYLVGCLCSILSLILFAYGFGTLNLRLLKLSKNPK